MLVLDSTLLYCNNRKEILSPFLLFLIKPQWPLQLWGSFFKSLFLSMVLLTHEKKLRGRSRMVLSTEASALKLGLRLLHSTADNLANGPCYAALIL